MSILNDISEAIQAGKAKDVKVLVQQALDEGLDAKTILSDGMLAGMDVVGKKFKNNEVFVPEVLIAARAMKMGSNVLKSALVSEDVEPAGKVLVGTVAGDMHDIGKNLVASMLEGCGFEVINLGVDASDQKIIDAVNQHHPDILALSALLTTTMGNMKSVIDSLTAAGLRDSVKIMVGGAPLNAEFAAQIGADGYSSNANEAVALAKNLLS